MNRELRKFGFNLSLAVSIAGFIMFLRHKPYFIWFSCAGSFFAVIAILSPLLLIPVKKLLDTVILSFGRLIGFISSLAAFYMIFAPIGILLRLFGKDLLHQKIDKKAPSYWIKRKAGVFSKKSHEQMG